MNAVELFCNQDIAKSVNAQIPDLSIEQKNSKEWIWSYRCLCSDEDFNKAYPDALSALLDFLKMTLDQQDREERDLIEDHDEAPDYDIAKDAFTIAAEEYFL